VLQCVVSALNAERCVTWMSGTSCAWMRQIVCANTLWSKETPPWGVGFLPSTSYVWMSHSNMSYIWMSMCECEWVTSYVWMTFAHACDVCVNESHHMYVWLSFIHMTWLIHTCMHVCVNESRRIYMNESCRRSTSHVTRMTCRWTSHPCEESCHTYDWVMAHICMSHGTHMNESCHTYDEAMSHARMSRVTYEWIMSRIWMSHVSYMNESCLTYGWVMSHIWLSHVTRTQALNYEWIMSHIWMSHVTYMTKCDVTCVARTQAHTSSTGVATIAVTRPIATVPCITIITSWLQLFRAKFSRRWRHM